MRHLLILVVLCALTTQSVRGQNSPPLVLNIWPAETIDDSGIGQYGPIGPERVRAPEEAPTTTAKWITNVKRPTITVFPPPDKNTGTAIIVCPGGGYWNLAIDLEGEEVASRLNSIGITAVLLKYRVPRRDGEIERLPAPGPLLDAQRAVRLVRQHAQAWGIDPAKIGILGFSAGGHLAIATATNFDQPAYEPLDATDKLSCRPDFAAAIYPGYLIPQPETGEKIASYIRIPAETPPVFLVHADDDDVAGSANSALMHTALQQAGISSEVHIYARGGHGFGVRQVDPSSPAWPASRWIERFEEWLRVNQWLP